MKYKKNITKEKYLILKEKINYVKFNKLNSFIKLKDKFIEWKNKIKLAKKQKNYMKKTHYKFKLRKIIKKLIKKYKKFTKYKMKDKTFKKDLRLVILYEYNNPKSFKILIIIGLISLTIVFIVIIIIYFIKKKKNQKYLLNNL